jgi:hypothetical protein
MPRGVFAESSADQVLLFEDFDNAASLEWRLENSLSTGTYAIVNDKVHSGSSALKITNPPPDGDVSRFFTDVNVEPNSSYRFSGWACVRGVSDGCFGANLCILNRHGESFGNVVGNSGWKYIECYFRTGQSISTIQICARLGMVSHSCSGTAWFDDLKLEEVKNAPSDCMVISGPDEPSADRDGGISTARRTWGDPITTCLRSPAAFVALMIAFIAINLALSMLFKARRNGTWRRFAGSRTEPCD